MADGYYEPWDPWDTVDPLYDSDKWSVDGQLISSTWCTMFRRIVKTAFLLVCYATLMSSCVSVLQDAQRQTSISTFPDLYEASIAELQSGLESGLFTSVDLVKVSVVVLKGCTHFLTSLIM